MAARKRCAVLPRQTHEQQPSDKQAMLILTWIDQAQRALEAALSALQQRVELGEERLELGVRALRGGGVCRRHTDALTVQDASSVQLVHWGDRLHGC